MRNSKQRTTFPTTILFYILLSKVDHLGDDWNWPLSNTGQLLDSSHRGRPPATETLPCKPNTVWEVVVECLCSQWGKTTIACSYRHALKLLSLNSSHCGIIYHKPVLWVHISSHIKFIEMDHNILLSAAHLYSLSMSTLNNADKFSWLPLKHRRHWIDTKYFKIMTV